MLTLRFLKPVANRVISHFGNNPSFSWSTQGWPHSQLGAFTTLHSIHPSPIWYNSAWRKKWYWHFWSIHPMLLENLNIDIFILWCNIFVVLNWWAVGSLGSGVREDVISIPTLLLTNCMALGKILNFLCLSLPIYRIETMIEPHQTFLDMVI